MELYEFYARGYDPITGIWIQQDLYRGELNKPPSLQRYIYVFNNPVSLIDILGFLTNAQKEDVREVQELEDDLARLQQTLNDLVAQDYINKKISGQFSFNPWRFISHFGEELYLEYSIKRYATQIDQLKHELASAKQKVRSIVRDVAQETKGQRGWCAAFVSDVYQPIYDLYYGSDGRVWQRGNASDFPDVFAERDEIVWENSGAGIEDLSWRDIAQPGDVLLVEPQDVTYNSPAAKIYGHSAIYLGDIDGDEHPEVADSGQINEIDWYKSIMISSVARPIQ